MRNKIKKAVLCLTETWKQKIKEKLMQNKHI